MVKYRDRPFAQRFGVLGDYAENVYEKVSPLGPTCRHGWRRPSVSMRYMSNELKNKPDYYASTGVLVEVMGLGRDGILKLKLDKYEAMKFWNKVQETALFAWNSSEHMWALIEWKPLVGLVQRARNRGIESFEEDGNEYYPIHWSDIMETASLKGRYTEDDS